MSDIEKKSSRGSDDKHVESTSVSQYSGLKGLYYNPTTQVIMLGFVCFMGPGLFNACNGLRTGADYSRVLDPRSFSFGE